MFFRTKKSKEVLFWEWFLTHSHEYFDFEKNRHFLFQQLKEKLSKIDDNLVFSFSTNLQEGKRKFIISADGIITSFPAVRKLVDASPVLKNWDIIAFRQPNPDNILICYEGVSVGVQDVFFEWIEGLECGGHH